MIKFENLRLMKKLILFLICASIAAASQAQKSTVERDLSSFNQLEVSGALTVNLIKGENAKASITAEEKDFENVITEVENSILKISMKKGSAENVKIDLYYLELKSIKQTGATTVTAEETLKTPTLLIETSGASVTAINVNTSTLTTNITGAGEVTLKGTADIHKIKISGAGNLKGYELKTQTTNATVTGAGEAKVNASALLNADVSGAGSVKYLEDPEKINVNVKGAGSAQKAGTSTSSESDTTTVRIGNKKVLILSDDTSKEETKKRKNFKHKNHWAGIDIGVAGYLSPAPSFGMEFENQLFELDYARSRVWNINVYEKNFKIYQNKVGVVTGLGFNLNRYHFNNRRTSLSASTDSTFMVDGGELSRKHRLGVNYLTVPLLLELNSRLNNKRAFHLAAGVIGGYRIGSRSVQVFQQERGRVTNRDNFNLNPFKAEATVRFGYGNINLFATYGLTELFMQNRGPELYPVSAGITLIGF
jgi:hypothetical protein